MREGHGTRGPRGMDTMGEAGERGQKKAVRYPCSAIVGPVAAGGPPGETHRGRLRGLRHWAAGCSGASAALCARGQAPRPEEPKTAYHAQNLLGAPRGCLRSALDTPLPGARSAPRAAPEAPPEGSRCRSQGICADLRELGQLSSRFALLETRFFSRFFAPLHLGAG
ncbi:unnamed protein product [Prorocentrum cordatum]|uniref:Uncharacterized protein n=1 Tax=Prorocentrum cordatum TaxID=2364126 RepID=A0ABN9YBZ9_9DINO|nr:unnamed protein product [Polarella glacialis]